MDNPTPIADSVRSRVRQLRKSKGLLLKDVSAKLDELRYPMSLNTLSKLEAGTRAVSVDDAGALAAVLEVDVGDLLRGRIDAVVRPGSVSASATPLPPEVQAAIDTLIQAATAPLRAEVADIRAVVANASVGFSAHAVVNRSQTPIAGAQDSDADGDGDGA